MDRHQPPAAKEHPRTATRGSHLFTVRLWKEEVAGGLEYRGSVQDVISGAFRSFRNWADMADFMIARMEDEGAGGPPIGAIGGQRERIRPREEGPR